LDRDGRVQLGTLGQGNHFLELQQSGGDGRLWVTVHSGSRAFGQAVLGVHLRRAVTTSTGLRVIDALTAEGRAYLADVEVALAYAAASRRAMLDAATTLMESLFGMTPDLDSEISCPHNFIRRETHAGEELWVHRKGAISARSEELGVVPGSMGTPTF